MKLFAAAAGGGNCGLLSGWEYEGGPQQVALKMATVLVAGTGIAASSLARLLCLAGVGNLVLIDTESAQGQPDGYDGQALTVLIESARQQNPHINLVAIERLDDLPGTLSDA